MATATFLERSSRTAPHAAGSSSRRRCRSTAKARTCARSTVGVVLSARAPRSNLRPAAGSVCVRRAAVRYGPFATAEDKPLIPTSVYAVSKRDHEELCLVVGAAYGVPSVALRFFNVYGPGQSLSNPYTGVAAIFASRLLNGNAPVIFEDGRQSRDFVPCPISSRGSCWRSTLPRADGARINLGTGRPSTVDDVAAALARGLGVEIEPTAAGQVSSRGHRHCLRRSEAGAGAARLRCGRVAGGRDGSSHRVARRADRGRPRRPSDEGAQARGLAR